MLENPGVIFLVRLEAKEDAKRRESKILLAIF